MLQICIFVFLQVLHQVSSKSDEKQKSFINSPFFFSEFQSVSRIVKIIHSAVLKEWHDMGQLPRKHAANSNSTVRRALVHRNAWTKPHSGKKCCQITKELQAEAPQQSLLGTYNIRPSKAKSQTTSIWSDRKESAFL